MKRLERLTTRYAASEDRIRISGELAKAPPVVLWLTRRLLDQLVTHLAAWLERQSAAHPDSNLLMSFAQEAAQSRLTLQPEVRETQESEHWLVAEVDITPADNRMSLVFKGAEGQAAGIVFVPLALRQWLGILYRAYAAADWPADAWPVWVGGGHTVPDRKAVWH